MRLVSGVEQEARTGFLRFLWVARGVHAKLGGSYLGGCSGSAQ